MTWSAGGISWIPLCYDVQLDFLIVIGAVSDISDALVTTMSLIMVNAWFLIPNERSAWIIIIILQLLLYKCVVFVGDNFLLSSSTGYSV